MTDACGPDPDEILQAKVRRSEAKYPVKLAYGNKARYTERKEESRE